MVELIQGQPDKTGCSAFGSLPGLLLLLLFHPVWDILCLLHVLSLLTLSQFCIINSFRNILEVSYDCTFMVAIYREETKVYTAYTLLFKEVSYA